jgi:ATP-dependent DNA helicase RecQ
MALSSEYVENGIVRPDDLVLKSTGTNSVNKLYHSNIDRKLSLDDIAKRRG